MKMLSSSHYALVLAIVCAGGGALAQSTQNNAPQEPNSLKVTATISVMNGPRTVTVVTSRAFDSNSLLVLRPGDASPWCIDAGGGTHLTPCNGQPTQTFQYNRDGTLQVAGVCLMQGDAAGDGTYALNVVTCQTPKALVWEAQFSGTKVGFRAPGLNACLDLKDNAHVQGTAVQLAPCTGSDSQQWQFYAPLQPLPDNFATAFSCEARVRVDSTWWETPPGDGTPVAHGTVQLFVRNTSDVALTFPVQVDARNRYFASAEAWNWQLFVDFGPTLRGQVVAPWAQLSPHGSEVNLGYSAASAFLQTDPNVPPPVEAVMPEGVWVDGAACRLVR